ncbi:MAG: hypothetical protein ACTH73_12425 [Glutamicibacter ardleyensis]
MPIEQIGQLLNHQTWVAAVLTVVAAAVAMFLPVSRNPGKDWKKIHLLVLKRSFIPIAVAASQAVHVILSMQTLLGASTSPDAVALHAEAMQTLFISLAFGLVVYYIVFSYLLYVSEIMDERHFISTLR